MYEYTFFEMKKLAMTVANLSSTGSSVKKGLKFFFSTLEKIEQFST